MAYISVGPYTFKAVSTYLCGLSEKDCCWCLRLYMSNNAVLKIWWLYLCFYVLNGTCLECWRLLCFWFLNLTSLSCAALKKSVCVFVGNSYPLAQIDREQWLIRHPEFAAYAGISHWKLNMLSAVFLRAAAQAWSKKSVELILHSFSLWLVKFQSLGKAKAEITSSTNKQHLSV